MLYDAADDPAALSTTELREAYETQIRTVVDDVGVEAAAAESGVDEAQVAALADGAVPEMHVEDAAALLALSDDYPDSEAIVLELRDHLLMGMTTGVLDVDTIASNVTLDLSGQEVQQALEGRTSMTLEQLAAIHGYIAERNDR
ncbi:hypothetical protein C499_16152 [Halogeometricum borinquense DSM 11551]|uniref:Uncharacterized protein n=1 Tax=Halogeometricum borinquense (strain ATCC 700274 / DSM 11551 / JCM 10706 / KCTC 4070 / PR3) TaxID=469382 RepID=E4NRX1_HALBP|nr:DUF5791 family protein [Halogeometricum borinquense]ADQ68017.1 hypothetical protein Hbor_24590 [Halogeometricum borinquense DSM 11551]ELY24062.1 hypothetical protein C499_16152 [Halogeometricum borinquense DSM 11551]